MAEKATTKKRSSARQWWNSFPTREKAIAERKESRGQTRKIDWRQGPIREAVTVADSAPSSQTWCARSGKWKSTIARTLAQLADRLEEEIGKYGQIRRAIAAKDAELKGNL